MTNAILYIGPVPHTADQIERLATVAGLSFGSRYAPHELVLVAAGNRPLALLAYCKAQSVIVING